LGTFGPLFNDSNDARHHKKAHIFGIILHALDKGIYRAQLDDGTSQDVYANRLHIESHFLLSILMQSNLAYRMTQIGLLKGM
jgi:hypothetical protein